MNDTAPEINAMIFEAMMRKSASERLIMGMDMLATAKAMVRSSLPSDLTARECASAFYQRFYGEPWPL